MLHQTPFVKVPHPTFAWEVSCIVLVHHNIGAGLLQNLLNLRHFSTWILFYSLNFIRISDYNISRYPTHNFCCMMMLYYSMFHANHCVQVNEKLKMGIHNIHVYNKNSIDDKPIYQCVLYCTVFWNVRANRHHNA